MVCRQCHGKPEHRCGPRRQMTPRLVRNGVEWPIGVTQTLGELGGGCLYLSVQTVRGSGEFHGGSSRDGAGTALAAGAAGDDCYCLLCAPVSWIDDGITPSWVVYPIALLIAPVAFP
jgi:hypothetical protein